MAIANNLLKEHLIHRWPIYARTRQRPTLATWTNWLLLGGRGAGKTRTGAEWIRAMALGDTYFTAQPVGNIALVAETYSDAREVMVEGQSGLLAIHTSWERPVWISSRRRLEWPNGAIAQLFSSEDPDGLRGPQFGAAWCDEVGKWKNPQATWDMLQFGLRLGTFPQQVITTTPRPIKLLKDLIVDKRTLLARMATDENRTHLAAGFFDHIVNLYRGTTLGRQELDGEIVEERSDTLWQREGLDHHRVQPEDAPPLRRIVVAVDPPVTGKATSDACGVIVAGVAENRRAYVLEDQTLQAVSPGRWVAMVTQLFNKYQADQVVIETNQGGDMAESVLRNACPHLPIRQVKASRGKWLRAEPVAHLYERGLVSHVGALPQLEDEMCDFGLEGLSSGASPDRLDALVWALTDLMLGQACQPRARTL
ncbi:MAG: terminase family protein [Rhizobiaceae bacterium]